MEETESRVEVYVTTDTSGAPHKAGEPKLYVMYDAAKPEAGKLYFTEAEWDAFVLGVRDGEFDLDEDGNLPPVPRDQRRPRTSRNSNVADRAGVAAASVCDHGLVSPGCTGYPTFMSPRARRPVLDSARFGRTPVLFLLGLAACCLIAIVALVIVVAQRGPGAGPGRPAARAAADPAARGAHPVPGPAGAGAARAARGDLRRGRGHRGHHRRCSAARCSTGVITTAGARAARERQRSAVSVGAAIGGALVAETLNGLVLLALLASRRTEIDGVEDGVVYGSMVGLGFALVANVYAYAVAWNAGARRAGRGVRPARRSSARSSRRCSPR